MYSIKEIYFTQQGEGYHTGRDAMFLRFTGCNLWTGYDKDKETAICNWCDTNFVGNDGPNGGKYTSKKIVKILHHLWPKKLKDPFLVCTGGEPLLQINHTLITVLSTLAGIIQFGILGLFIGPIIAAMAITMFDIYQIKYHLVLTLL